MLKKEKSYWGGSNKDIELSEEFKDLFQWMVYFEPEERPSIEEIKKRSWFNSNPIATSSEVYEEFNGRKLKIKETQQRYIEIRNQVHKNLITKPIDSVGVKKELSSKKVRASLIAEDSKIRKSRKRVATKVKMKRSKLVSKKSKKVKSIKEYKKRESSVITATKSGERIIKT